MIAARVDAIDTVRMPVGTSHDIVLAHGRADGDDAARSCYARTRLAGYGGVRGRIGVGYRGVEFGISTGDFLSGRIRIAHIILAIKVAASGTVQAIHEVESKLCTRIPMTEKFFGDGAGAIRDAI